MNRHEIDRIIEQLSLDEKIGMIHGQGIFHTKGVERLGVLPLWMSDGPMGVRKELQDDNWKPKGTTDDFVSYLPSNSALACSWNPDLEKEAGHVLGEEARGRGKDVILAPGINIMRSPLCGRNFEYMSEDPYLIKKMAVPFIEGIQENDVAACVKHFAVNNQETRRLSVDAQVDERALREIYLPGFEACVKEGKSLTIMGAYNKFRGQHCCHNHYLLEEILRGEWGFDGVVISDWGGVHDTLEAAENGLDIEMSVTDCFDDYFMAEPLKEKVKSGEISESLIDEKVRNILRLMERLHMLGGDRKKGVYNTRAHQETLLECARESVVLLKNEEHCLPLDVKEHSRIGVIGENAVKLHSSGGGSAAIKALYELSPLMGLKTILGGNVQVEYAPGYSSAKEQTEEKEEWQSDSLEDRAYKTVYQENHTEEEELKRRQLRKEAVELAKNCDKVILFCGLNHEFDAEGQDKSSMKLPYGQEELIEEVLNVNENTIIVIIAGSPVDMESFADRAKAIVYSSYNGMEGGRAMAEVLLGITNPSGKLPYTMPRRLEDCPAHKIGEFPGEETVDYKEGIFVGYRFYEKEKIPVRYCFGHGLSYTEFQYDDLHIENVGGHVEVSLTVKNTGTVAGKEVVQVYVEASGEKMERPSKELKGFLKSELQPQEERKISFILNREDFSYYNEEEKCFWVPEDQYSICVGSSVQDIRLRGQVSVSPGAV